MRLPMAGSAVRRKISVSIAALTISWTMASLASTAEAVARSARRATAPTAFRTATSVASIVAVCAQTIAVTTDFSTVASCCVIVAASAPTVAAAATRSLCRLATREATVAHCRQHVDRVCRILHARRLDARRKAATMCSMAGWGAIADCMRPLESACRQPPVLRERAPVSMCHRMSVPR